ncbi:UrcA family protein [Sphingopyxis sp. QXT-31]|uniref:UrcA family protein n=1 Tax=Sphingopyxis sp. QXT-31 TaxID=1357916 RepID=UPI0012EB9C91|nr:UrcA family protein [Sphingopyxis sp. QXT-31]
MNYKILTSLFALAAATLPSAAAAEPAATLRVDLTGIDLATPRGAEAAQRRIDRAVARFCRNDVEHLSFGARRAARECRESVQRDALAILDSRRAQQLAAR